ncbi:DUF6228 family protein [Nonomuraea wenchangensis]|uniref:DUF6228 family protein n=1 Tax=Nonomuraea wenchangensis TaxID=568860 RepID=UPI0037B3F0C3
MSEPFVLEAAGGRRWIVGSPQDPHGDGYVQTVTTELHDDGMTASTVAKIDGQYASLESTLPAFVAGLAADWRGWAGEELAGFAADLGRFLLT